MGKTADAPAKGANTMALPDKAERSKEPSFLTQFAESELKLIKDVTCPNSTQAEFNFFIYDCQMRGLNPLKKEIHFVKRRTWDAKTSSYIEVAAHQVGIDGLRIIAERTGKYNGQDAVEYGEEVDFCGVKVPKYATVIVHKKGVSKPFVSMAYFSEFAQVYKKDGKQALGSMWAQMPYHMIAKCAESLALRKAFPDTLGGIYSEEELAQMENEKPEVKIIDAEQKLSGDENEKAFEPKRTTLGEVSF